MTIMAAERDHTLYRQAHLILVERSGDKVYKPVSPRTTMICWLPSAGLRDGMIISLKGQTERWCIQKVLAVEKPRYLLHTDWHVGGL